MECKKIKEKLSDYIENLFSDEERLQIDEHLNTCSKCALSLDELKKTIAFTQGIDAVEPPSWLKQKTMARIREEAGQKRGFLQKLFFPLHIKIPIEIVATLAIAVTAFYVFKTVEPEMKYTEVLSGRVETGGFLEEKVADKADRPGQKSRRPATDAEVPKAELDEDKKHPASVEVQETLKYELAQEHKFDKEADVFTGRAELYKTAPAFKEERPAVRKPYEALGQVVTKQKKIIPPENGFAFVQGKKADMVLTLLAENIIEGIKSTEQIVKELEGRILESISLADKDVLIAELDSDKLDELRKRLGYSGEVKVTDGLSPMQGKLKIRIEIQKIPSDIE